MSRRNIKTIIDQEIKDAELHGKRAMYIFDFDDTLVTDSAQVYVKSESGRKALAIQEFHDYVIQDGEMFDFGEFNEVTNPRVHDSIMNLLKEHIHASVILTARSRTEPIREFLDSIGVQVGQIVAVGSRKESENAVSANAVRKRDWIDKAIQAFKLNYVEFWDDNEQNITEVESLQKKFYDGRDVQIITHLVRH